MCDINKEKSCWNCHWCWLGRCVNTNTHYGRDVSVNENQPSECSEYITKEEWNQIHVPPLKQERCMELLNAMIDNLHVTESNTAVIKHLLHVGFEKEELLNYFHYPEEDVNDAMKECSGD